MGQEIDQSKFKKQDFVRFQQALEKETRLLSEWFTDKTFANDDLTGGFELEAWLIDDDFRPAPINDQYLKALNDPLAVPELAKFNVEVNSTPQSLHGNALKRMEMELNQTWKRCNEVAQETGVKLLMTGILPTVRDSDLTLANMSHMTRYKALNEQVFRMRGGKPIKLDIYGREHLVTEHQDVMLESAATSFQIHLQTPLDRSVDCYNTSIILSAPMVAMSANSPYLFGKDLWDETRIPLFEQAVAVGGMAGAAFGPVRRVSFGTDFARGSLMDCFEENRQHFPVLLPIQCSDIAEEMTHLSLHNGTIWRWNRPLIGFNDKGVPHVRIEHRVTSAGPSVLDLISNAAFFFGLSSFFLYEPGQSLAGKISFAQARDNFYAAAKTGLDASFVWKGKKVSALTLLREELLPQARTGLERLALAADDIDSYLGVVEARLDKACNGATWQRQFVDKYGRDMKALTVAYYERQCSGLPIHEWDI
ncbi:MAG: glutamate--cysteine ligase [Gammaproteobacteria bacterium]|nr:glutamate--cysteine ligase [Gammaproteobacteria bacterium]